MPVKVQLKHLHISPRKVRLVADLVRGLDVQEAEKFLTFNSKKASQSVRKLLKSAVATAKNDFSFEEENLFISEILVNEGATLKRWMPRAYGRAYPILKRTSHIIITLEEKVKSKKKSTKKSKLKNLESDKKPKEKEAVKKIIKDEPVKKDFKDINKEKISDAGNKKGIFKKVFRRKSG